MRIDKSNMYKYISGNSINFNNCGVTSVEYFPEGIRTIHCGDNNLTELPPLPKSVRTLNCESNYLTTLPYLPIGLIELYCSDNKLHSYPDEPFDLEWNKIHNKQANRSIVIKKVLNSK